MKCFITGSAIALVAVVAPSVSRAALSLDILLPNDFGFPCIPGVYPVDLVFHETGTPEDERLAAYDIGLRIVSPAGGGGINFVTGPGAVALGPNPVFNTEPPPNVIVVESTPTQLLFDVNAGGRL